MTSVRMILIPVDRYRVDYEVGLGAPFSRLDALVLRAIAEERATAIAALCELFLLPRRLLIESIVSLSRAGWVAVGGIGEEFSVTVVGQFALNADVLPTPDRVMSKQGSVLVERLTGQVASLRDLTYWTAKRLQEASLWDRCERLTRNPNVSVLDAGQAKPLLSRDRSEWIRWVGEPIPQQEVWLKIEVEPSSARVFGLPELWSNALLPKLAEQLRIPELSRRARHEQEEVPLFNASRSKSWPAAGNQIELVLSGPEHLELLKRALSEARSQVLIASAFASADVIERDIRPLVLDATAKGVRVDMLWGYSAGGSAEERDRTLKALNGIRKASSGNQMLRFNERPSGSHAKLLLWDAPDGAFKVCLGSNNWLSMPIAAYQTKHQEVSIVSAHLGLASDLCTSVAGIWSRTDSNMAGVNDLWHRTASEIERVLALQEDSLSDGAIGDLLPKLPAEVADCAASVIRDQQHESVMRELLLGATRRIGVVSHKMGPTGLVRLASAQYGHATDDRKVRIIVGEVPTEGPELLDQMIDLTQRLGGTFLVSRGVHAKIVVADDVVLVSSYNFLSADPFSTAEGTREVGILLCSKDLSDLAWNWIESREGRQDA